MEVIPIGLAAPRPDGVAELTECAFELAGPVSGETNAEETDVRGLGPAVGLGRAEIAVEPIAEVLDAIGLPDRTGDPARNRPGATHGARYVGRVLRSVGTGKPRAWRRFNTVDGAVDRMPNVLVVTSDSHPIETELFSDALGPKYAIRELELPAGTLHVRADEELSAALSGAEAVFLRTGEITETVIERADSLEAIAVHGSGYDHIDLDAATEHGVVVTHSPEGPGPAVVEYVLSMAVSLLRELPERIERTEGGEWSRRPSPELRGLTVGVVGLGYIGSRVARALSRTFGSEVIAYDPFVSGALESDIWPRTDREAMEAAGVEFVGRSAVFERADLVTLHTPLTDRTKGMVGTAELRALEGGYLINTARGGIVDTSALVEALDAETIERVALDVLPTEPPESDDPLLNHPRSYVTAHIASATTGYPPRAARAAAEKIETVLSGGRPETVVNPAVYDT